MKKPDAKTGVNDDAISSDCEETGAQDLSGLSLSDLEALFERELGDSDRLQAEADCLSRRSSVSLFRAGRVMAAIRHILKSQGKWTKWQNDHKVSVTSAWQAIQLFSKAGSEEAVAGLTRTEALQKFDITKHKPTPVAKSDSKVKKDTKVAPVAGLKLHAGDSQETEEQPTTDDTPQGSSESETPALEPETPDDATAAQPESAIPTTKAMEFLHMINVKLEDLERDLKGVTPDDHLLSLIDQAISTLRRLRGDAATDIDAA